ncbi:MAG TPA: MerR family transcriptional regulator [Candidatus Dormibacteraeota bacterium]|nr:MerR family transcriptional regulator [Candidatus Dormibacteraeota bacterium]
MAGELSVQAAELAIGEVSRRSGQTVVTLRHWESMGLLPPPPRIGGKRRYPAEILSRIAMIDLLRRCGFSLEEVGELLAVRGSGRPPGVEWRALMVRKQAELDELATAVDAALRLVIHLTKCRCHTLDQCLTLVSGARAQSLGRAPADVDASDG